MKKISLFICLYFCAITICAQEHLKFMGIPLTGTISQFQTKLQAKGVFLNDFLSSNTPSGTRIFNGTFSTHKAMIIVWYNKETKIVYGAKAVIEDLSEKTVQERFDEFARKLRLKYGEQGETDEDGNLSFTVLNTEKDMILGIISVYKRKNEDLSGYPYHYTLHIEYNDFANYVVNAASELEDL